MFYNSSCITIHWRAIISLPFEWGQFPSFGLRISNPPELRVLKRLVFAFFLVFRLCNVCKNFTTQKYLFKMKFIKHNSQLFT